MGKGPKHLNQLPLLSQVHYQETGLEVEQPGWELVPDGMPALQVVVQPIMPQHKPLYQALYVQAE